MNIQLFIFIFSLFMAVQPAFSKLEDDTTIEIQEESVENVMDQSDQISKKIYTTLKETVLSPMIKLLGSSKFITKKELHERFKSAKKALQEFEKVIQDEIKEEKAPVEQSNEEQKADIKELVSTIVQETLQQTATPAPLDPNAANNQAQPGILPINSPMPLPPAQPAFSQPFQPAPFQPEPLQPAPFQPMPLQPEPFQPAPIPNAPTANPVIISSTPPPAPAPIAEPPLSPAPFAPAPFPPAGEQNPLVPFGGEPMPAGGIATEAPLSPPPAMP